jgi:hypothetical protein
MLTGARDMLTGATTLLTCSPAKTDRIQRAND